MNKFKQKFTSYLAGRNFASSVLVAIVIASVVFVNMIIYALASVYPLYLYSPVTEDFSISAANDAIFQKSVFQGKTVTVTFCSYEDEVKNHDTGKFVYKTAKEFEKRYPDFVKLRYINVITKLDSDGNSVAEELAVYEKDKGVIMNKTSVIFSTETSYKVVTDSFTSSGYADFYTLDDRGYITSYNGEEAFASSVLWTLKDYHGTAYFTTGHGESANLTLYNILVSAGYKVAELNLRKSDVPEDAALVIISSPTADFERGAENSNLITEYDRLMKYAEKGGKFFVTFNPYAKKLPVIEGFIENYGITIEKTDDGDRKIVKDPQNAITTDGFTLVAGYGDSTLPTAMLDKIKTRTEDLDGNVILREVAALKLSGNAKALLVSSPSSVCYAGGTTVDEEGSYTIAAYSTAANDSADDSKLFFMSEGYLTASDAIVSNGYSNKEFLFSLFDVFFGNGNMPYGCREILFEGQTLENLTMGAAKSYTAALLAIPAVIAVVGVVIIIRRKNR